jgi:hypothetical protein
VAISVSSNQGHFHSDARSGSVVDDRIRPALESGAAVGSTKPVLLVIDEIDGATGAGENVRFLFLCFDNFVTDTIHLLVDQFHP